jgi:tRNA pseudouridine55 synthase
MFRHQDILLVNKPRGITSFTVIRELRKKLGVQKIGHAGTLDPLAEGLLVVGVGAAGTKKLTSILGLDKTYEVEIEFGETRDTGDKGGNIVEERAVCIRDVSGLENVLKEITGDIELPVPAYSAVKKAGVPLYRRARRGEHIVRPVRTMRIYALTLADMRPSENGTRVFASVEMHVGSGVYVRSIVEEIGRRLSVPATVSRLVRTKVGDFTLSESKRLEEMP